MLRNADAQGPNNATSMKKTNRCRSFHFRYLELCRARNLTPLPDIRSKNNTTVLDFFGDKLGVNDWLLIVDALHYDHVLQTLAIRLRKGIHTIYDQLDTEKKAKLFKQKAVICTKFIISGVVAAVANCIEFNKNLKILHLEGLPFNENYIEYLAKALSSNESLKEISFQRTLINDNGCEAICNTVKYLANVEILNLSECELTQKGAFHIADMIKVQKIIRYTEGWQKSLRYRDVDPETIPGLRSILIARNLIGDEGLIPIIEVLKEDVWIKVVDVENCGLTDRSANLILDCLELNHYIVDFNIRNNPGISKFLLHNIRDHFGKADEDHKPNDTDEKNCLNNMNNLHRRSKGSLAQLREQFKKLQEQLAFERVLRKKAEILNEKLNQQILAYERQIQQTNKVNVPEGYVVVKNESLQSIIRERNNLQDMKTANLNDNSSTSSDNSDVSTPRTMYTPLPKKQNIEQAPVQDNMKSPTEMPQETSTTPRKVLKVRKVKSEMKYVDPINKDNKKESKSDHELANETDFNLKMVQFETNIGDTAQNVSYTEQDVQIVNVNVEKKRDKIEMDDLSISTTRTSSSDDSNESDTLRNIPDDFYPMKIFIRQGQNSNHYEHNIDEKKLDKFQVESNRDVNSKLQSPRSIFFGFCNN